MIALGRNSIRNWSNEDEPKLIEQPRPAKGVIDSQSVKRSEWGVVPKSYDGHKKVNGRKRHIVVNTLGLVLVVVVHAANMHDSPAAWQVVIRLAQQGFECLTKLLADSELATFDWRLFLGRFGD